MDSFNPLALLLAASLLGGCAGMQMASNSPPPLHAQMSDRDVLIANQTLDRALQTKKSGIGIGWANPANGHSGTITPTKTYRRNDGRYCRDYVETLTIADRKDRWQDTACRAADGRWFPLR